MKLKTFTTIILVCLFYWIPSTNAQQNETKSCKSNIKGGKYKRAEISSWYRQPRRFSGNVLIKPKNINKDFLILMAKRLKSEYCGAEYLKVAIYDNATSMDSGWEIYNKSKGNVVRQRGNYVFDRITGQEYLEFSTKLGNPISEIRIDLTKEP
jgi:hypothetical protein